MFFYLSMIDDPVDREKFQRLYLEYRLMLYKVAYKILLNDSDAEDAVHESFIRLTKNLQNVHEENSSKSKFYLVVIVRNISLTMLAKRKSLHTFSIDEGLDYGCDESSTAQTIENEEDYASLIKAISSLSKNYSDILMLKYD